MKDDIQEEPVNNDISKETSDVELNGNDVSPRKATKVKPAPKISSKTQYWYGRVNYWTESNDILKSEVECMSSVGVTGYIIEMAGWGRYAKNSDIRKSASSSAYKNVIKEIKNKYTYLHSLCKTHGIWLFCSVVNDNAVHPGGKHGVKQIDPKHYYNDIATDLLNIVLKDGPENVIVQPVAELYPNRVKNHPGPAWHKKAISKLKNKGFRVCNNSCKNDDYGRPTSLSDCHYLAWHPNFTDSFPSLKVDKSKIFIVSDTGPIISQLNNWTNADKVDANCNPTTVKSWRSRCIKKKFAVCGYYDYKRKKINKTAILAMAGK